MKAMLHYDADEKKLIKVFLKDDKEVCPYTFINHPIARQYAGYIMILQDLFFAKNAIEETEKINNKPLLRLHLDVDTVKKALLFSAIITYGKCFSGAEGRKTTLNHKEVLKRQSQDIRNFHEKVIELRNRYIAHSGETDAEQNSITAILNPDLKAKKILSITDNPSGLVNDDSRLNDYKILFNAVFDHVKEKVLSLKPKVEEIANEMDIEELYDNSKLPDISNLYPMSGNVIKM